MGKTKKKKNRNLYIGIWKLNLRNYAKRLKVKKGYTDEEVKKEIKKLAANQLEQFYLNRPNKDLELKPQCTPEQYEYVCWLEHVAEDGNYDYDV